MIFVSIRKREREKEGKETTVHTTIEIIAFSKRECKKFHKLTFFSHSDEKSP